MPAGLANVTVLVAGQRQVGVQGVAPRTLQRFLESIVWDEQKLRDRCQEMVANEHANLEAIGCIDETGIAKSGRHTTGVKRQYNGNRGKVENCVNHVALEGGGPGRRDRGEVPVFCRGRTLS